MRESGRNRQSGAFFVVAPVPVEQLCFTKGALHVSCCLGAKLLPIRFSLASRENAATEAAEQRLL